MILEYLFTNLGNYNDVEKYNPEKVSIQLSKVDNSECFIAKYSTGGENEESAKILSMVDEYIMKKYQPIVLLNGSSAYYNQKLYPYINAFERKLRKLLYLKSILSKSNESSQNITDLEARNLGEIFDLLFTDKNFINKVKSNLSNKTWNFTKREFISSVQAIAENTVWNALLGEDAVSKLQERFVDVKNYRNDVMHAHNINTKLYVDSKKLFMEINNQLDKEINNIVSISQENSVDSNEPEFNEVLSDALALSHLETSEKINTMNHILGNNWYNNEVLQNQNGIINSLNYYGKLLEKLEIHNNISELLNKQRGFKDVVERHAEVLKQFNENTSFLKALHTGNNYKDVLESYSNVIKNNANMNSVLSSLQKQNITMEKEDE